MLNQDDTQNSEQGHAVEAQESAPEQKRANSSKMDLFLRTIVQLILVGVIIFGGYKFYHYKMNNIPEARKFTPQEREWVIETTIAKPQNITPMIELYGETISRRVVDMRSFVAGQIIDVNPNLKEGLPLKKGDALIEIDSFDYQGAVVEAQASLREAEAQLTEIRAQIISEKNAVEFARSQLNLAKKDLERVEALRKSGSATDKNVDDRRLIVSQRSDALTQKENNFAVLNARIEQRQAQIERLNWAKERAERNLADTILRAPFDAVVTSQNAETGRLVSVNDVVASLQEQGAIDVKFIMPDSAFGRIAKTEGQLIGRPVTIYWTVGGERIAYQGSISRLGANIAAESGGIEIFASIIIEKDQLEIRPGAFVEVLTPDITYKNVIVVPQSAIYDYDHVFVKKEGRLQNTPIQIIGSDGNNILVTGDFTPQAEIMSTRIPEAGTGVKVRGVDEPASSFQQQGDNSQLEMQKNAGHGEDA